MRTEKRKGVGTGQRGAYKAIVCLDRGKERGEGNWDVDVVRYRWTGMGFGKETGDRLIYPDQSLSLQGWMQAP